MRQAVCIYDHIVKCSWIRASSCMTYATAEPSRQCSDIGSDVRLGSSLNLSDSGDVSKLLRQPGPGTISGQGDQVDSEQSTRLQVKHRMMLTREQSFAQVARENQSERTLSFQAWHVAPSPWGGQVPLGDTGMASLGGHPGLAASVPSWQVGIGADEARWRR